MTSLTEFFNKHEDDTLKGISHKNSIIKRNIIAHMAVNGECTLSELTKELHISVPKSPNSCRSWSMRTSSRIWAR